MAKSDCRRAPGRAGGLGTAVPHSEQLLHGLNDLRQRELLCDVVLRVGDLRIAAHRAVLASCSPYFRAMFTANLSERAKKDIEFHSVEATAMQRLMDFAYTGQICVTQCNVLQLLPAANLLQMKPVLQQCCEFLLCQLHPTNCIGIGKFAEIHACTDLYDSCLRYQRDHFTELFRCEEYLQLSDPAEIRAILEHEDLAVDSEEDVFHAIEAWIQHDEINRRCHFPQLFPCLRLSFLSLTFLHNHLESNPLVVGTAGKVGDLSIQDKLQEAIQFKCQASARLKQGKDRELALGTVPRRPARAICAVGGKNGLFATLDSVEIYVPESSVWTKVAPLTLCRFECSAVVLNHRLYVIGGMVCDPSDGMSCHHHDKRVECWDVDGGEWVQVAPMKRARSALAAAVLCGSVYALGGYDGKSYLSTVERYSPQSDQWQRVAPMLHSRSCFGASTLDNQVYALGGYGPPCLNRWVVTEAPPIINPFLNMGLSSAERYDPSTNTWQSISPMAEKRINFGVGCLRGFLYVVGGHNGVAYLSSMERYDPYTNQWTTVAGMGQPRTGLGVGVVGDSLYAVGGHSGTTYLSTVQCYDPYSDIWQDAHKMNTCRCSLGLTSL